MLWVWANAAEKAKVRTISKIRRFILLFSFRFIDEILRKFAEIVSQNSRFSSRSQSTISRELKNRAIRRLFFSQSGIPDRQMPSGSTRLCNQGVGSVSCFFRVVSRIFVLFSCCFVSIRGFSPLFFHLWK